MKKTLIILSLLSLLGCTKHWEGDFRGAPRNVHAVTESTDGVLGNDGSSVIIVTEPTGTLIIDVGEDLEYGIRWQVDGGAWSSSEGLSRYVPFVFPNLPTTKGTHTVSGEVYQIQAPEINYPFSFTYTITGEGFPISLNPAATDGAWILSGGALALSVEPTAQLSLLSGNPVEHSVRWRVDGGAEHSSDGLFVDGTLPLTYLDTAPGTHTITGTVCEKDDPTASKDFSVTYDMGAAAATIASLAQTRPGYLYYAYDIRDIAQSSRSYLVYRAPVLTATKSSASESVVLTASVDGGPVSTLSMPENQLTYVLDSALATKAGFGQHTVSGSFYVKEASGRITHAQPFSLGYSMTSIQTIEEVTASRVMMVKGGTQTTLSPNASGVYEIDGAQQLIVTSDFSFSGQSPYFPFMELDMSASSFNGFTYAGQKEQHVSTTSYPGVFGSYVKFTSVFYYFNVPSSGKTGTMTLRFTDGVNAYPQTIKFKYTK